MTFIVPERVRTFVRQSETAIIVLALAVGGLAGLFVWIIGTLSASMHQLLFQIGPHQHLSSIAALEPVHVLVPAAGGLLLGITGVAIQRWRAGRPVDPIEANALRGGQMSLLDSLLITGQTVLSNGFGASVGLEAGYTQIGSGVASRLAGLFALRRADIRTMVGCGAAGAIAAAFGAPLTGAFYAFELIMGTYAIGTLAPIVTASISGVLVANLLGGEAGFMGRISSAPSLSSGDIAATVALAAICAFVGIAIMRGVTLVENLFKGLRMPSVLQPVVGGLVVGGLALVSPMVLSSGHGALFELLADDLTVQSLLFLCLLKALAAAVSLGSGFRGGLFFASLFMGAILGKIFAALAIPLVTTLPADPLIFAIIGMTGLSVAVVGGPLTMSFLALETTGDLPLSMLVLAAATAVSVLVRRTFGYSFATWRLHLRGEAIRSAHDVGWLRDLTVRRLMRADVKKMAANATIARFRKEFPLGSTQRVVAVDGNGHYQGMILVPDAHVAELDENADKAEIAPLIRYPDVFLLPSMNVQAASRLFESSESEALAVVDSQAQRQVVGLQTEAHLLRRYAEELESARRDLAGEKSWSKT
jgi:CIC family chloride channel protein